MKLAKFFQLVNVLTLSSFLLPSFLVIHQKAYANDSKVFQCIQKGYPFPENDRYRVKNAIIPTLIMNHDEYDVVKILQWRNKDFLPDSSKKRNTSTDSVRYNPENRCDMVAERFNYFYECDVLSNIIQATVTVNKTKYPAIFVTLSENKTEEDKTERAKQRKCLEQKNRRPIKNPGNNELYLLFMLSKDDSRNVDHDFCNIRGLLNGDGNSILFDDNSGQGNITKKNPLDNLKEIAEPKIADIKFCAENIFSPENNEIESP